MQTLITQRKKLIKDWRKRIRKCWPGEWRRGHQLTDFRYGREYDLAMASLKIIPAPVPVGPVQMELFPIPVNPYSLSSFPSSEN